MPEKWVNQAKAGDYLDNPGWTVRTEHGSTEHRCTECTFTVYGAVDLVKRIVESVGVHPHADNQGAYAGW